MKIRAISTTNRDPQNPVTVEISNDDARHLVRGGKEIEYKDLYWDEMRLADDALDDLYDLPLFDGERIMSSDTKFIIAWQPATLAEEEEEKPMKKFLFEATPDGNALYSTDKTIRAIVQVPEGASDDYGYLTMKQAILDAYHGNPADLVFWYDGQEQYLAPDAAAPCDVQLDIEEP